MIVRDDYAVSAICDCGTKNFARMHDRLIQGAETNETKVFQPASRIKGETKTVFFILLKASGSGDELDPQLKNN